ncbi:hypothetical protein [Virgibacillus salexigens]|nr:hypothetical protein [Virgibacillus massiliensis]
MADKQKEMEAFIEEQKPSTSLDVALCFAYCKVHFEATQSAFSKLLGISDRTVRKYIKNVIRNCWYKSPVGEKCINKGIAESKITEEILKEIKNYRDELAQILEQGQGKDNNKEYLQQEVADLQKELKSIEVKQDRLDDLLEDGIYTKEKYMSRMEKLTNKQKDVETELDLLNKQLKKQDTVQDKDKIALLDAVLDNFDGLVSEKDRNRVFKSVLSYVELKRPTKEDEGEINVNFL